MIAPLTGTPARVPSEATSSNGFKIYIPLQGEEKNPEGGEAGKSGAKDRKG